SDDFRRGREASRLYTVRFQGPSEGAPLCANGREPSLRHRWSGSRGAEAAPTRVGRQPFSPGRDAAGPFSASFVAASGPVASTPTRKLLIVEDDPGIQNQLRWCFE